ncbi:uncharacterized protein LOC114276582 isoform X2 [Camellia sinensis]|uniref:uncharacterized protein LOC114276582 isoform X2 n=1 Tax=Camellia sinensis TaxID=4442 RepID=UPI001035F788|nr:uncharacterized protein LOC114276582 isoform X2 [Camellia sinensis]
MGEKRSSDDFEESSELGRKRVKMRDLDSVLHSEEMIKAKHHPFSVEKEKSDEVSKDATKTISDFTRAEITAMVDPAARSLDLNTEVCVANNSASGDTLACSNKLSSFGKDDIGHDVNLPTSRGFGWDLNAEDVSNSLNQDPFYPYKNHENLKSGDASECGSTTGPLEEKDPMRVWKEMKQNGFLSSSHGGIPVPKPRGRKSKSDGLKKKMELAKREQVDRFAKIAAPSGLLNELNPGIINHVRNSKQVHSIIEALVRSEKLENRHAKQANSTKSGTKEITDRKDKENVNDLGINRVGLSHDDGSLSTLSASESVLFNHSRRHSDLSKLERWTFGKTSCSSSHANQDNKDDILALKLSSSITMASENTSSLSNEESANLTSVSSLSVKAASVASQWLELLHQDTKGRLAALRRSKKRVQSVIHTELPFLMSREFSCNQENDPYVMKNSAAGCSDNASVHADVHQARWSALFEQMDKGLSEEEKQLESWLNQVKEMQLHCERGLQHFHYSAFQDSQWLGTSDNNSRLEEVNNSERELAITAAAASIYSTCNFLLSTENLPCF